MGIELTLKDEGDDPLDDAFAGAMDALVELQRKVDGMSARRVRTPEGQKRYGLPIGTIITSPAMQRAVEADRERREALTKPGGWQAPIETEYPRAQLYPFGAYKDEFVIKDLKSAEDASKFILESQMRYGVPIMNPNEFIYVDASESGPAHSIVPEGLRREHESWFKRHWGVEIRTRRERETDALIEKARNRTVALKDRRERRTASWVLGGVLTCLTGMILSAPTVALPDDNPFHYTGLVFAVPLGLGFLGTLVSLVVSLVRGDD